MTIRYGESDCFGGINMDLFAYLWSTCEGETITASSIEFYLGGKGANQAVAASRLGAEVAFVGTAVKMNWREINKNTSSEISILLL